MTKFARTIKTTTYTCKVYNAATDALETADFTVVGTPLTGRKLQKLVENESKFAEKNLQFLHVIKTETTEGRYSCSLEDFLTVAKRVYPKTTETTK